MTPLRSEEKGHPLATREARPEGSQVRVGPLEIGGSEIVVAAGPCSVESEAQIHAAARAVAAAGARLLRGGAFKPRTSPYDFQGMGEEGLRLLAAEDARSRLPTITEVMTARTCPS